MKRYSIWLHLITLPTISSLPLLPLVSYAAELPTGATVTAGNVSISTPVAGSMLIKQDTQRAIIKWNDFSIGSTSLVTFAQPDPSSATLNIITGSNASSLAGGLKANGSVFLVNENGITVTSTGLVDTRTGFIASSLPLGEADFMAGSYRFNGQGGAVINRGKIRTGLGGTVALIGSAVSNSGFIEAPLGKVALGSAQAATLDIYGDGFLQVILPSSALQANGEALVSNSGTIMAEGGSVMLKAATIREALRNAVSMSGDINARSVSGRNGAVVLEGGRGGETSVSGTVDVSTKLAGISGGVIDVSGDSVVLKGARLDASAPDQGGLVRVGGAFQGARAQEPGSSNATPFLQLSGSSSAIGNARTTMIDASSSIDVSANGLLGSGGTAVVWSDSITDMLGKIAGGGARTAGAIEISSAAYLRTIDLRQVSLGNGGTLLLDPQDISIENASATPIGNYAYADNVGNVTRLRADDLTGVLSTGATVNLQASRDISWLDNFSFVTRPTITPGGTLNLSAGRSISLSGIFETGGGNWNLVANDTAAHGVVDADRTAGSASINLLNANFINSNGALTLSLASGAGNTHNEAGGIVLPKYSGESLTATIAPGVQASNARISVRSDITVSGAVTLSGNLELLAEQAVTIGGRRVNWTDEKTGATVRGYGDLKFVENGKTTRLARFRVVGDATQLALGDDFTANVLTREYGDTDPTLAQLGTSDWHNSVFQSGSLIIKGPGVLADAGVNSVSLETTPSAALNPCLNCSYFIDLTPVSFPMAIEKRTISVNAQNSSYVYGSPRSVVSLSNIVNGDLIVPISSVNGGTSAAMLPIDSGFGLSATLAAGNSSYAVNALSGAAAANYQLNLASTLTGNVSVDQKALNYQIGSGTQVYGQLNAIPSVQLTGKVGSDDVRAVASLTNSSVPITLTARTAAGSYQTAVAGLSGTAAGNYRLSASGNVNPDYVVSPRPLLYTSGDYNSVYGTTPIFEGSYTNLLSGDSLSVINALNINQQSVVATPTLPVGVYGISQNLTGPSAANYFVSVVGSANSLSVTPKPLSYVVGSNTQIFGADLALPTPVLSGIVGNDQVSASANLSSFEAHPLSASGKLVVGGYVVNIAPVLAGTSSGNYSIGTGTQGSLFVVPKPITYQLGALTQQYGTVPESSRLFSGVLAGDAVAGVLYYSSNNASNFQFRANTPVGNYSTSIGAISGSGAGNYVLAQTGNSNGTLAITPKVLNWRVSNADSVYGNDLSNYTALDLVQDDSVRAELAAFDTSGALVSRPVVGGAYTARVMSLSGRSSSNYMLATSGNQAGAVNITPREIVPFKLYDRETDYGGEVVSLQVLGIGLLPEDRVVLANVYISSNRLYGGSIVGAAPAQTRSAAGDYTAYIHSIENPNYRLAPSFNVSTVSAQYSVRKKSLGFSLVSPTVVYGNYSGWSDVTLSGVMPGDVVGAQSSGILGAGSRPDRIPVGSYPVSILGLTGPHAANYEVSPYTVAGLTIIPRPLQVDLALILPDGSLSRPFVALDYGVLTASSIRVQTTIGGVLPGDEATTQVRLNSPLRSSSFSGKLQAGSYQWSADYVTNPNYVVRSRNALTLAVNPLAATYVPTAYFGSSDRVRTTSVYGESAGTEVRTALTGVLPGDYVVPGVGTFGTSAGPQQFLSNRADAGTYTLDAASPTGFDSNNYTFTRSRVSQVYTITPRPADVSIETTSSVYGDQGKYGTVVFGGILAGDEISAVLTGEVGRFQDIGDYKVNIKEFVGAAAGNYEFKAGEPNVSLVGKWTVLPRPVTVSGDKSSIEVVYGDGDTLSRKLAVSNVADNGLLTVVARAEKDNQLYDFNNNRIDAGRYTIVPQLEGPFAANYVIDNGRPGERPPINFGILQINKRPLVTQIARELEYGGVPTPSLGNLATGDSDKLDAVYKYSNVYSDRGLRYGYLDVGGTKVEVMPGNASLWRNYMSPEMTYFTVVPRTLKFEDRTFEYGKIYEDDRGYLTSSINPNGIDLGRPTNLIGGDNVRGVVRPFFNSNQSIAFKGSDDLSDPKGFALTAPLPVGERSFTGYVRQQLSPGGPYEESPYYRFAESTLKITTIKRSVYMSGRQTRQYGNFAVACPDGCDPYVSGVQRFDNVIGNEDVYASLLLPDVNFGPPVLPVDAKTPVGRYERVSVSPLAGKDAENYVLAGDNTLPYAITLTIEPLYLKYVTSSALIVGQYVFGSFGVATLKGPYGDGPIPGDDVTPVVTMKVGDTVVQGLFPLDGLFGVRHQYFVTSLTGKDAANYRIYPQNTYLGIPGKDNYNIIGSATQVEDTSFGFADSSPQLVLTVPTKPPVIQNPPPVLYKPAGLATTSAVIGGNATNTSLNLGATSVAGQASSAAGTSGSIGLGNAEGKGEAQASADGNFTAGPTGASASGKLVGTVSGGVTFGPGEVVADGTASTSGKVKVGPTGAEGSAEAAVQANVTTKVQGDIGSGANGNAAINGGAVAGAITTAKAGYVDGAVGTKVETMVGGGVSAGGQMGLISNAGSLNTGVAVYSPGLVGGKLDLSGGYSGGSVRVALNLGAAIGLGGLSVKLDFSLNVANMAEKLADFNTDLRNMLTMYSPTSAERAEASAKKAIEFAGSFGSDKLARLAFLTTSSEWRTGGNVGGFGEAERDVRDFNNLKAAITQLQKDKMAAQNTLLRLMETDPAGAASWYSQNNYAEYFAMREWDVGGIASRLGIQIIKTGDTMSFANR